MTQHNNEDKSLETYFNQWLQGEPLSEDKLMALQLHPVWSERMLTYSQFSAIASDAELEPQTVPKWNKTQGFDQYLKQPSWWQQQGLSLMALTFSIFACVVMLFDLRLSVTEGGVNIATNSYLQKQQMQREFAQLEKRNNELIQTRLDNFQTNQQQSTAQLVSYVLNNSRLERQEDIQDVVEVFQQQREDDLLYLKQQFNDISYQIRKTQFSKDRNEENVSLDSTHSYITEE